MSFGSDLLCLVVLGDLCQRSTLLGPSTQCFPGGLVFIVNKSIERETSVITLQRKANLLAGIYCQRRPGEFSIRFHRDEGAVGSDAISIKSYVRVQGVYRLDREIHEDREDVY